MIHRDELRFGNVVKSRSRNEIITIDSFDIFKRVSRLSVTHEYVPLDESWLLRFGFRKEHDEPYNWSDRKKYLQE